jgi:hypothetical protein
LSTVPGSLQFKSTITLAVLSLILVSTTLAQTHRTIPTRRAPARPAARTAATATKGSLSIEAAVVYRSGQVAPAARRPFYLLSRTPSSVLTEANFTTDSLGFVDRLQILAEGIIHPDGPDSTSALRHLAYVCMGSLKSELAQSLCSAGSSTIGAAAAYQGTTGFDGKLDIADVIAGHYHLFGTTTTRAGMIVWSMPVEIGPTKKTLILDTENAFAAH